MPGPLGGGPGRTCYQVESPNNPQRVGVPMETSRLESAGPFLFYIVGAYGASSPITG